MTSDNPIPDVEEVLRDINRTVQAVNSAGCAEVAQHELEEWAMCIAHLSQALEEAQRNAVALLAEQDSDYNHARTAAEFALTYVEPARRAIIQKYIDRLVPHMLSDRHTEAVEASSHLVRWYPCANCAGLVTWWYGHWVHSERNGLETCRAPAPLQESSE